MKNTKRILAVLAAVLLVVLAMTGCSTGFKTVGEYLADEEVRSTLDAEIAALEGSGLTMEIYADGNTLVYDCAYVDPLDLSDAAVKDAVVTALEEACIELTPTYTDVAEKLRAVVKADDIKVRLVYRNADDSVIYTHEYE